MCERVNLERERVGVGGSVGVGVCVRKLNKIWTGGGKRDELVNLCNGHDRGKDEMTNLSLCFVVWTGIHGQK